MRDGRGRGHILREIIVAQASKQTEIESMSTYKYRDINNQQQQIIRVKRIDIAMLSTYVKGIRMGLYTQADMAGKLHLLHANPE